MRPVPIQPSFSFSVCIGNRQLFRRVQGNDLRSGWRENDFFLDARRGDAVACRAIGLYREDHPGLELDRLPERAQARDERPFVQAETQAVAEVETESIHLARKSDVLAVGSGRGNFSGVQTRLNRAMVRII